MFSWLRADADDNRINNHVTATLWANWFFQAAVFEEVVLFMDCCRDTTLKASPMPVRYGDVNAAGKISRVFAFGAMPTSKSYEKTMPDGLVHGVFAWALLEGLNGLAAKQDGSGRVTAGELEGWLFANIHSFFSPDEQKDRSIPKEPRFEYETPVRDQQLVLAVVPPGAAGVARMFPVEIHLSPHLKGKTVELEDGKLTVIKTPSPKSAPWHLSLERGRYVVVIREDGIEKPFNVTGRGAVDVEL
jgi:hypothetical protein